MTLIFFDGSSTHSGHWLLDLLALVVQLEESNFRLTQGPASVWLSAVQSHSRCWHRPVASPSMLDMGPRLRQIATSHSIEVQGMDHSLSIKVAHSYLVYAATPQENPVSHSSQRQLT